MKRATACGLSVALVLGVMVNSGLAQATLPVESPEQRDQRMAWWREARFGMFIHWGLYAIPAGQWQGKKASGLGEWIMNSAKIPASEYEKLAAQFNPVQFDAQKWVSIAKDAGMKYIVITSKHHDGFCLFDSKFNDYNIMSTPFRRDIMKELSGAAAQQGVRMCWYHSIMDWHHPQAKGPEFPQYVQNVLKPQLRELLTNYGKIGVLWFDGEWIPEWTDTQGHDMVAYLRGIQPDLIINNRVSKARKGMEGMSKDPGAAGDFGTPEQQVPATGIPGADWETCMTMNNTWGYRSDDSNWKSSRELIRMLIDTASKGGNLLLNVGPTAEGVIPEASVQRLADIGKWMKVNGEAIYGTSASPFNKQLPWGRCTQKPGKLYLHVFDWPKNGQLQVPTGKDVKRAYLLADPAKSLAVGSDEVGVQVITLPAAAPDPVASVVVLETEGQPQGR